MSISKDRVQFSVPFHMAQNSGFGKLFRDVFGSDLPRPSYCDGEQSITVVCRPSQFARFLIERNNRGFANGFKELNPQLIMEAPEPRLINVSSNPASRCGLTYNR